MIKVIDFYFILSKLCCSIKNKNMKTKGLRTILVLAMGSFFFACQSPQQNDQTTAQENTLGAGQSGVTDDVSQQNIVQVASGSADHSTLVAAVKAADYVDALVNAGPFTVFAPTNAAFDNLPEGTVDGLLKPEMKLTLQDVLEYHVAIGVYKLENLKNGQSLGMANGQNVSFEVVDDKVKINGANVIATVPASNGIIHVIDAVLLPK
jgi:uncharacterized surface protein with fasciclin (FAS1) repeats